MTTLPLIEKVDLPPDSNILYEAVGNKPYSFLLDSSLLIKGLGRYSFLGSKPFLIFRSKDYHLELISNDKRTETGHPLSKLKELLNIYKLDLPGFPFPFCGGTVGYFSYDLGRTLEKLPELATDDLLLPDLCLGFYDIVLVVDQVTQKVYMISTGLPEKEPVKAFKRARQRLKEVYDIIINNLNNLETKKQNQETLGNIAAQSNKLSCHFNQASYCKIVQQAKEYIKAGEIYQVNLSQRFTLPQKVDSWDLYKRLKKTNPAPMAAYLNFGDVQVISSSPERFLLVNANQVETRPIKGTRPRGRNTGEDLLLRNELWNSEKDRAELVMIVDLERNDLGRVCRTGSVQVPELFRLEEYSTVFHLVSTIVGELPEEKDVVDLLKATFPGGSITGAPKIKAMEIIEELEPVRRGIYTGSIGYIGFNGNMDLNIVIRTIIIKNGNIHFQVGGGITADSDPLAEYQETLDKARAIVVALGLDFSIDQLSITQ